MRLHVAYIMMGKSPRLICRELDIFIGYRHTEKVEA